MPVKKQPFRPSLTRFLLRSKRGFTLIEILVAVSVLAICLVVIMQLFSGGLRSRRLSGDYSRGIIYAESKMGEILLTEELGEKTLQGEFDDTYRWQAEISLFDLQEGEKELPVEAYLIEVQVLWRTGENEKRYALSTIRLKKKDHGPE